jgi:hypothetical protein
MRTSSGWNRAAAGAFLLVVALPAQDGFQPLCNGRDLSEWVVVTPSVWSVKDGVIVGKTDGLPYHEYLRTRRNYADFTLKLRMRLVGGRGNSGVQFRSRPANDPHNVAGYQADAGVQARDPKVLWGALYCEARHKMLALPPQNFLSAVDLGAWHDYAITAEGTRIVLEVDGVRTVEYVEQDPGADRNGFIALQVHGSKEPMEVHFKDLRIKVLERRGR